MRAILNISVFLQDVNNILQTEFILVITDRIPCSGNGKQVTVTITTTKNYVFSVFQYLHQFRF